MTDLPVINCDGCGICCMHMAVPPFLPEETDGLPEDIREEFRAILATREIQFTATDSDFVPCAWFDWATRQCRHYDHRPEVCREFEVGCDACVDLRRNGGLPA